MKSRSSPARLLNTTVCITCTSWRECAATRKGLQEGTIGVAVSPDLKQWEGHLEPIISYLDTPYDNLYVSGAVVTDEGRVAIMFSAQKFPEWQGFMLAMADHPMGPFFQHAGNPVYKHFSHAHEFDLIRAERLQHRYLLFYAGFTPEPQRGLAGDRGYLLYSDDLVNWHPDERNPVFGPETLDNWDGVHVRPRSLNRSGDMWYLWYEGCNTWQPEGTFSSRLVGLQWDLPARKISLIGNTIREIRLYPVSVLLQNNLIAIGSVGPVCISKMVLGTFFILEMHKSGCGRFR